MEYDIYLFTKPREAVFTSKIAYPITERDHKLEKLIAKEYECPVCLNYCSPPIMMCINSHVICFECWKRCTSCPTCRSSKTLTRAFTLEKIHPLISIPCKWDGCSFIASASYTTIHEHLCKFYPLKCPLSDAHSCRWTGNMANVQKHLRECHEENVYFQPNVFLVSKWFGKSARKDYTIIFVVDDRLFKFYWSYDTSSSTKVRFGMVSIGNGNPTVIYNYTVVFAKRFPISRNCRKLKLVKSHVKKSFTDCSVVNRDPRAPVARIINHEQDYADLVSFCNHGDLVYQVIIEVSHFSKYFRHNT